MILNHVTSGPGLVVKCAPTFDPEVFRHRDLNALDVVSIPKRLQKAVGEPEVDNVVDWPLPQIMIDAEDRGFRKVSQQDTVQYTSRRQVRSERLLHNDLSRPSHNPTF